MVVRFALSIASRKDLEANGNGGKSQTHRLVLKKDPLRVFHNGAVLAWACASSTEIGLPGENTKAECAQVDSTEEPLLQISRRC